MRVIWPMFEERLPKVRQTALKLTLAGSGILATRDHYVSRFFLPQFVEPTTDSAAEPWLWVADVSQGTVRRRAPKNIAWSRDLFSGPGGLADRRRRLEEHLAEQVEGPAARALREFVAAPIGTVKEIPSALTRHLAWLAARSLTMKTLYESWIRELEPLGQIELVEPPPSGPEGVLEPSQRTHTMEHPQHGTRAVRGDEIEARRQAGWQWRFSSEDFLEMVHLQAWDFQAKFFPKLSWEVLDAPSDTCFVTCDRPAVWGVDGLWEVPPSALRHPRAELIVPLSRARALFGFNPLHDRLGSISPHEVNRVMGLAAHAWIAGPTEEVVERVLRDRPKVH
jgi:hypothetical protein